jgi:hypothetical protein
MDAADEALVEAWRLRTADYDAEVEAKFEDLLPLLVGAGYAEATEYTWNFTPKGVARAEQIATDG